MSQETVRRLLRSAGLVWRRPRPVLGPKDPAYAYKLGKIRRLLRELPAGEVAVFQDEVDINTNPKIGSMWMWRGVQVEVVTPGNNEMRYLAGSLNWRTGELILTEGSPGQGRNTDLFLAHLDDLRRRLRRYRVIHVICDNAKPHKSGRVAVVTLRFAAPKVDAPTMVLIDGWVLLPSTVAGIPGGSYHVSRGVIVQPKK